MRAFLSRSLMSLTAIALLDAAAPVAAGEYRDAVYHFRVKIPPGWRAESGAVWRARVHKWEGEFVEDSSTVSLAGFRPEADARRPSRIMIEIKLFEWTHSDTRSKIERNLGDTFGMPVIKDHGDYAGLVRSAGDTRGVLDWDRNRFIYSTMDSALEIKFRTVTALQFCKAGSINIYCFSALDTFDEDLPAFQFLNDSFAMDEGFEFQLSPERKNSFLRRKIAGALICCGISLSAIAVLGLILSHRKRRRDKTKIMKTANGKIERVPAKYPKIVQPESESS